MTHGIIIPCCNEASSLNLKSFIDFARKRKDVHLCFVNDGSNDLTRSVLANIKQEEHDNVYILNVAESDGKRSAVREGAIFLFEEAEVNTVGLLDTGIQSLDQYEQVLEECKASNKIAQTIFDSEGV